MNFRNKVVLIFFAVEPYLYLFVGFVFFGLLLYSLLSSTNNTNIVECKKKCATSESFIYIPNGTHGQSIEGGSTSPQVSCICSDLKTRIPTEKHTP